MESSAGPAGPWGEVVLHAAGLLLTVLALLPGARFWFDLLNRVRGALGF